MNRQSVFTRRTKETDISVKVELATAGTVSVDTGIPFFDHMLSSFGRHGRFGIDIVCRGDIQVDAHHSVEDTGLCLGTAVCQALGDKAGIQRFGEAVIPMDDALILAAADLSGRPYFAYAGPDLRGYIGTYSEELTEEFFRAFCSTCGANLHIQVLAGKNRHHIHEGIYKAAGIALYRAVSMDPLLEGKILSTKGVI